MPISLDGSLGINSSGNVTAPYYFGNGRFLTGINGSGGNGSAIFSGNSSIAFDGNNNAIVNIDGTNIGTFTPLGLDLYGNLNPVLNVTYTLGNATNQWKDLWVSNNTIYINSIPLTINGPSNILYVDSIPVLSANTLNNGNIEAAGNVSAGSGLGNTTTVSNLGIVFPDGSIQTTAGGGSGPGNYGNSNVVALLSSGFVSSNVITSANISGGYILGNGAFLTGIPVSYTNANVTALLASGNVNSNIITTANVSATNFIGNGSQLTGLYGNAQVSNYLASGTNTANIITTANVIGGNLTTTGTANIATLRVNGLTTLTGNTQASNVIASGTIAATGNVAGGNIITPGSVYATANVNALNVNTNNLFGTAITIASPNGIVFVSGGNINAGSSLIHNVINPVEAGDAANKGYVDSVAQGLKTKPAVVAATTTALIPTAAYLNGGNGVGATLVANSNGPLVIDGTANVLTVGSRVLVKNEVNAVTNGIYVVTSLGDGASPYGLIRATDFDIGSEIPSAFVFVTYGNVNASTGWTCTNPETPTPSIGVNNIVFDQFSYAGGYTAGNGLALNGSQFVVNTDPQTTWINGSNQVGVKPSANLTTPNIGAATFQTLTAVGGAGNITANNAVVNGVVAVSGNLSAGNVSTTQVNANGNITTTANIAGNYFLGNGRFLSGLPATYTDANVTALLASGNVTTNIITTANVSANVLTVGSLSNLGNIGNVRILGGNVGESILTDGTGNLTWGLTTPRSIPAVYFQASFAGNNQSFISSTLASYSDTADLTVFYNGALLEPEYYSLSGSTLTVNTYLNLGDTIDITRQIAGNVYNITSGYNDGNVVALLTSYSGDIVPSANLGYTLGNSTNLWASTYSGNVFAENYFYANGVPFVTSTYGDPNVKALLSSNNINTDIRTTGNIYGANISGSYFLGNGAFLTGLPVGYTNANATALFASGNVTSNVITTGNISGNYYTGNGRFLTGLQTVAQIPAVYFTAVSDSVNQSFSNVILGAYTANSSMTVFVNGALLENSNYTLVNDTMTVTSYLGVGDNIDVITSYGGDIQTIQSGYGNSNVAAFFNSYSGDIIPAVNSVYNLGSSSKRWLNTYADNFIGTTVTTTGNISTSGGNINATGMTINGNAVITGNAQILGTLTYNDVTAVSTSNLVISLGFNQVGSLVDGGGITVGNTAEASWTYDQPTSTWNSNIGIDAAGNITAPYFLGDGSQLSNMYGNANVTTLLEDGSVSSNIVTTGNVSSSYLLGDGSQLSNMYGNANVITLLSDSSLTSNVITTGNVSADYVLGNGSQLSGLGNIVFTNLTGNANVTLAGDGTWSRNIQELLNWNTWINGANVNSAPGLTSSGIDGTTLFSINNYGYRISDQNGNRGSVYWEPSFINWGALTKPISFKASVCALGPATGNNAGDGPVLSIGGAEPNGGIIGGAGGNAGLTISYVFYIPTQGIEIYIGTTLLASIPTYNPAWFINSTVTYQTGAAITNVDAWYDFEAIIKPYNGKRYLEIRINGSMVGQADITSWIPTGNFVSIGGRTGSAKSNQFVRAFTITG